VTQPTKHPPLSLAMAGYYSHIKWEELTAEDIKAKSPKGYTLLHHAAKHGYWERIPKELRDKKYWSETKNGSTILICAYQGKQQEWVDKKSLTTKDILKQNTNGDSIATLSAKAGRFLYLPQELITLEVLHQKIGKIGKIGKATRTGKVNSNSNDTVLHQLARTNQLPALHKKYLTEEILSSKGNGDETIYHILSSNNIADQIPKELWTKKSLTLQTEDGTTPLHHICKYNCDLLQLTPKGITLKDILLSTQRGTTPLHLWANTNKWYKIPDKFLTTETLELTSKLEPAPIHSILKQFKHMQVKSSLKITHYNHKMEEKLKFVLSKTSDKMLKNLYESSKPKEQAVTKFIKQEENKRKLLKKLKYNHRGLDL